jgi:peroxiredoxin
MPPPNPTLVGPGDLAPDASLANLDGLLEMLSTAWRERPAAVIFLRYFGCPICRQQVLRLRNDRERFERAGMDVVLVGHGGPEDARRFVEARPVPFRVLVDPSRAAYERYGLKRGTIPQVFGPQCVAPMVRAALQPDCRQGLPNGGNVMQMPGAFVVDTAGVILLARRSETIADNPTTEQLLAALGNQRRAA